MDFIKDVLYKQYLVSRHVTTDSRTVKPGSIFFALKGEHVDGNDYIEQALLAGAALCVTDRPQACADSRCVLVPDVVQALQELAAHHRSCLDLPVIGITGTNGKTTTKELVSTVLRKRYRVHATQGNLNNHLGVPLTLLSMPSDAELLVVEMGANHRGEIEQLCSIARPTHGIITNVGRAHLAGFGSFEGVIETKTALYRSVAAIGGVIVVNSDNKILLAEAEKLASMSELPTMLPAYQPHSSQPDWAHNTGASLLSYGTGADATVKGSLIAAEPYLKFYFERGDEVYTVSSNLVGAYNLENALAAVSVGTLFGVEMFDIKQSLESYTPTNNRSQQVMTAHNCLIMDCYNANPSSVEVALDSFLRAHEGKRMVCLGAMKELGEASEREHRAVVERLVSSDLRKIVLVGEEFLLAKELGDERIDWYRTSTDAAEALSKQSLEGYTILLKGSNSTAMWKLKEVL